MNIILLHETIRLRIDEARSPRFDYNTIDSVINTSARKIVKDRYDSIKKRRPYSFESIQRLRDELYTLVNTGTVFPATGSYLQNMQASLDRYWFLLELRVKIGSDIYTVIPTDYDELGVIEMNPHRRVKYTYPSRLYWIEDKNGIKIIKPSTGTLIEGYPEFLMKPIEVNHGIEISNTTIAFAADVLCRALEETIYDNGTGPQTFKPGQSFTLLLGTQITSGIAVYNWTDSDLPDVLEEELTLLAAAELTGDIREWERYQSLKIEAES